MGGRVSVKYNLEIASSQSKYIVTSRVEDAFTSEKMRLIICDRNVQKLARATFPDAESWILVVSNEELKTLDSCSKLLEQLAESGVNKEYQIIAIGGGALQDAVTLVASLYMRGLDWVYVPSTLMSMMDSCIGGKSSINLGRFKNTVGNFYPPKAIFIDPKYVATLSPKDISCGIAEGAKICFAESPDAFQTFVEMIQSWRESGSDADLLSAIFVPLEKKKWFIEVDEFDQKERKLLNFGHSFGHALEAASRFSIPHGIGVLVGMQAAIIHAKSGKSTDLLEQFIGREVIASSILGERFQVSRSAFLEALRMDKKNGAKSLNLILPDSSGRLSVTSFPLEQSTLDECWNSIISALTLLKVSHEVL
jgi:3-dehydroquinate synthase